MARDTRARVEAFLKIVGLVALAILVILAGLAAIIGILLWLTGMHEDPSLPVALAHAKPAW